jgi:adenylate cyclase
MAASYQAPNMPGDQSGSDEVQRQHGDRRRAAFAFVDIVGYSILMSKDETRTHVRWMRILNDVIRPQTQVHHGSIVKSTGDGILAEFPTALDAVAWARAVQHAVIPESSETAGVELPVALRIAVNMGEIFATAEDIYGDSVNLAARLQEHAEPGGIVLSEPVYQEVRESLGIEVRDLGHLELKHVQHRVRAFELPPLIRGISVPVLQRRVILPSIAILPFENPSGNRDDDYFGDGIVEDITVSLASLRELLVISRASTLKYRGQRPDPRQVGEELGVRYVLFGTVRRSHRVMRISAHLYDTQSGATLWGDTAQVPPDDLFDVQDETVRRIVGGIAPYVREAEMRAALRKRPDSFTAYDYTLRALDCINSFDRLRFMQARDYLQRAMAEDREFAMPLAWAARWHSLYVGQGWSEDRAGDTATAMTLASRAIELDRQNALALATFGHLKSFLSHDYDTALVYLERALAASPSSALAWISSSPTLAYIGRGDDAIRHAEHALRLSPFDRELYFYYTVLGVAYFAAGNYDEAVRWCRMGLSENPGYTANLRYLIASLVAVGRLGEAREFAAELLRREPNFRLGVWRVSLQPFRVAEVGRTYIDGLVASGLPE